MEKRDYVVIYHDSMSAIYCNKSIQIIIIDSKLSKQEQEDKKNELKEMLSKLILFHENGKYSPEKFKEGAY